MAESATERERVTLRYVLTRKDIAAGARYQKFARRMLQLATGCLGTVGVIGLVLSAAEGELHWFVFMPLALPLALWLRSLGYARVAKVLGETTMQIDDEGVRASRSSGHAVMTWQGYGGYVETSEHFVLVGPDRGRTIFTVLPKRAATDPADVHRLRAILRRHLPPLPNGNRRWAAVIGAVVVLAVIAAGLAAVAFSGFGQQQETAVDACELLGVEKLSKLSGSRLSLLGASAGPYGETADAPWWTSCEYGRPGWAPGRYILGIAVYVDADFEQLMDSLNGVRPGPEGLGDAARIQDVAGTTSRLWVAQGSSVLDVTGYEHGGESIDRTAVTSIARAAIENVPASARVRPVDTGPACEAIDLAAAEAAAGAELPGRRQTTTEPAGTDCDFRGRYPAFLNVSIREDEAAREEFARLAARPDAEPIEGLGAEAFVPTELPMNGQLVVLLKTSTSVFEVYMWRSSDAPTPEQRAFLESLTT